MKVDELMVMGEFDRFDGNTQATGQDPRIRFVSLFDGFGRRQSSPLRTKRGRA